jgi:hypothetical protein
VDWEDMTHDFARNNMYIGDFGNNSTARTDLKVYKIPYPTNVNGNSVQRRDSFFISGSNKLSIMLVEL